MIRSRNRIGAHKSNLLVLLRRRRFERVGEQNADTLLGYAKEYVEKENMREIVVAPAIYPETLQHSST